MIHDADSGSSPHVAVIILTLNQRETTLRCLASLQDVVSPRHTILVWDNGSTDGTADAVRATFPDVVMHWHPTNLGVPGGRNTAAALAIETLTPSHLLFLDNDTIVTPDFLNSLLTALDERHGNAGLVYPKILLLDQPQRLDSAGCRLSFWNGHVYPIGQGEIDTGQFDKPSSDLAGGCCFLIKARLFQAMGGFDVTFGPYGMEDIDFSLRVKNMGYTPTLAYQAVVFHKESKTLNTYNERYARRKTRNWLRFLHKHASMSQQAAFFLCGLPYVAMRALIREGRKGNLRALRGIFGGIADLLANAAGRKGR